VPSREYEETLNKARALLNAIEQAEAMEMTHAATNR
jgi:anthranilate/para-aminobenzoate synthase component I